MAQAKHQVEKSLPGNFVGPACCWMGRKLYNYYNGCSNYYIPTYASESVSKSADKSTAVGSTRALFEGEMEMAGQIDIVMVSCDRLAYTRQFVEHLWSRTDTPFRLIAVDNGSTDGSAEYLEASDAVSNFVPLDKNGGIHAAKNAGLALVESEPYYVDTDNDALVPSLQPDWLERLIGLMDRHPEYGAIACRPQVMVGEPSNRFDNCGEIREMDHAGAWLRIMRTAAVKRAGGWRKDAGPGRNNEDLWIAGKLRTQGLKVGVARDVRCCHLFGRNWGYPEGTPHGHKPTNPPPEHWDAIRLDPATWEPLDGKEVRRDARADRGREKMSEENWWLTHFPTHEGRARFMRSFGEGVGIPSRDFLLDIVGDGESFLDVGCGPGIDFENLVRKHHRKLRYRGYDLSPGFVDTCRALFPEGDFRVGDALALPEPDESWDTVLLRHIVEHTAGYEAPILEAMRVARKRVVIVLWRPLRIGFPDQIGLGGTSSDYNREAFRAFIAGLPAQAEMFEVPAPRDRKNWVWVLRKESLP